MSTISPNPQNMLILAGLGIGAYWLLTRPTQAQTSHPSTLPSQGVANPYRSALGDALGAVTRLFGGNAIVPGTVDGRSATPWDVTPAGPTGPQFNNPSAYVNLASSAIDGLAVNPTAQATYDAVSDQIGGTVFQDNPFAAFGF